MNPFVSRITNSSNWVVPLTAMSLLLGFMIALAWVTKETRNSRMAYAAPTQAARVMSGSLDLQEAYDKLLVEVAKVRDENTKFQNALAERDKSGRVLNDSLQDAKIQAGLTELEGPGIKVTLKDSDSKSGVLGNELIVHDMDVLRVVNELWASGAEAISVNNHRVSSRSSFRCVGPVIHVDSVPVASPVVIRAIGDPDAMLGGLKLPMGVLDEMRQTDPAMVQIEAVKKMRVYAYTGSTEQRFAKVPPEVSTGQDPEEKAKK